MNWAIFLPPSPSRVGSELMGMELRNMRIIALSGSFGSSPASPAAATAATILAPNGSASHSP